MAHFIWFDNDNLDYGGIGVVEYGNTVGRIITKGRRLDADDLAENDNPPPVGTSAETKGLCALMEQAITAERDRQSGCQRLLQVGPKVSDGFDADRQAQ